MTGKKRVLFVCVENAGRSQMAEAFAKEQDNGSFEMFSAGSNPAKSINPVMVSAMKEFNIDISGNIPKGFSELPYSEYEYVVTMGCGDSCPFIPAKEHIDWKLEDPKGKSIETIRKIRDEIRGKVIAFMKGLS